MDNEWSTIFEGTGGWYFWDEHQYDVFGPYKTREEAVWKLDAYGTAMQLGSYAIRELCNEDI